MQLSPGSNIPLSLELWDGNAGLYAKAFLFLSNGTPFSTPSVILSPNSDGLYVNNSVLMPAIPLLVIFKVYSDAGYTMLNENHTFASESITPDAGGSSGSSSSPNFGVAVAEAYQPTLIGANALAPSIVGADMIDDDDIEASAVSPSVIGAESFNKQIIGAEMLEENE